MQTLFKCISPLKLICTQKATPTLMTLPGSGDTTVPAADCKVPVLAQVLIIGLLNSYASPPHHRVSTCSHVHLMQCCLVYAYYGS